MTRTCTTCAYMGMAVILGRYGEFCWSPEVRAAKVPGTSCAFEVDSVPEPQRNTPETRKCGPGRLNWVEK